jgi:hypothetical protein
LTWFGRTERQSTFKTLPPFFVLIPRLLFSATDGRSTVEDTAGTHFFSDEAAALGILRAVRFKLGLGKSPSGWKTRPAAWSRASGRNSPKKPHSLSGLAPLFLRLDVGVHLLAARPCGPDCTRSSLPCDAELLGDVLNLMLLQ